MISSILLFSLSSCSDDNDNDSDDLDGESEVIDDKFETNTQTVNIPNSITISFNEDGSTSIANPFEDAGVSIANNDSHITITSTNTSIELSYIISGKTNRGSLKIYSDYKFGLVLNGTSIVNDNAPAINIQSSKKATITLVENSNNRLIDGTSYTLHETEDMKGSLFSEGQLVFEGAGNLIVWGRYNHAICSDDYIRINSGSITIQKSVNDGIHAKDYFEMNNGNVSITSVGDGIDTDGYVSISGGKLNILSTGNANKGIKAKGDIAISGGETVINTTGNAYYDTEEADTSSAAGIKAKGNCVISDDAILTVISTGTGGKGINIDGALTFDGGTTTVTTSGDQYVYDKNNDTASKAIKSTGDLTVNSGTIKIKTSKTEAEGLESKATLTINGGLVEIEAYDDAINASNHIEITGGKIYCISETNDAIDSNGTLTISGGTIVAVGATSPECGFDCDNNTFKITGGTVVGIGGSTSNPTSNVSTQRSLVYGATSSYEVVHIESEQGETILSFNVPKKYSQRTTLLFSSPDMKSNTSYAIYHGGSISGGTSFHGLYSGESYVKGTSAYSFTANSIVTTIGSTGGAGGRP